MCRGNSMGKWRSSRITAAVAAALMAAGTVALPTARAGSSSSGSSYGSGIFGTWRTDQFGLPAYRYTLDQQHDPRAGQPEVSGRTDAWHQVGNDFHHAFASNDGYTQLWSQARSYQWANMYDPANDHFAGGFGYLRDTSGTLSTLWLDRPANATTERDFGVGYFHHRTETNRSDVDEYVYAPFGSDSVLLHDVTITNRTSSPTNLAWYEYWDVNPRVQPGFPGYGPRQRGTDAPVWDPATRTMTVQQMPEVGDADPRTVDTDPLAIYAASLNGPTPTFDTDTKAFFGAGTRAAPQAVQADQLSGSIAPAHAGGEVSPGTTMVAFRSPVALAPGQSITLRYAYGMAHAPAIADVVHRYATAPKPLSASEASWRPSLPDSSFPGTPWLPRELQWDAYMVRSRATPEEACNGRTSLSQGGYYQYSQGYQGAYRDPLQHLLPLIESDRPIAKDVIRFSAQEQDAATGAIPYAMKDLCVTYYFGGVSDDLDVWLMLAAARYVLSTKDTSFLDEVIPYQDGRGSGTLWDHMKLAEHHQETVIGRGIHGLPNAGTMGDWADFSVETNQMTESTLVGAQLAYVYPQLADVAGLRGDSAFAAVLDADAQHYRDVVAKEWSGGGWYSRGYSGASQIGGDTMWSLTQPWASLAGLPDAQQANQLATNFRHYLTGVGMPGGPSRGGSALQPPPTGALNQSAFSSKSLQDAVSAWWSVNEPMVAAYAQLDETVPNADGYAWDEFLRGTLANLATVHPEHWDGVISADDVCDTWWTSAPYTCGVLADGTWDTH